MNIITFIKKLMQRLVVSVYGNYTHHYTIHLFYPGGVGRRKIEYIGNHKSAVVIAKHYLKCGSVAEVKTASGHTTWTGRK